MNAENSGGSHEDGCRRREERNPFLIKLAIEMNKR
jgi:hypothetical protein